MKWRWRVSKMLFSYDVYALQELKCDPSLALDGTTPCSTGLGLSRALTSFDVLRACDFFLSAKRGCRS